MFKPRQMERIVKGFANHRRITMLELLDKEPELSLQEIATKLKINMKTASDHLRRLAIGGHVLKRNHANSVLHRLSSRGEFVLEFLRKLE